jgi:hypothetical protein
MSEGFTGRLKDEIGKQTDRGTWPPPSLAHIFLLTQLSKSHHQNKLKFVWAGGPELKPFSTIFLERHYMFCFPWSLLILF